MTNKGKEIWKTIGHTHVEFNNDNGIMKYIGGYRIMLNFEIYNEVAGCVDIELEKLEGEPKNDPGV